MATTTVDLPKSYKFVPADIVVDAGATVTWANHDDFTHNVTFGSDAALTMQPGASVTRSFPTAGTFDYRCSLHPNDMQGSVPLNSLNTKVDYGYAVAKTGYGIIGVRVWVNHGKYADLNKEG